MKRNMKIKTCLALLTTAGILLAACSQEADTSGTQGTVLTIAKDGSITEQITETFEEEYYSLSDLQTYVQEEVDAYNASVSAAYADASDEEDAEEAITVTEVSTDMQAQTATVVLTYADAEDYAAFNYISFTLTEAAALDGEASELSFADTNGTLVGTYAELSNLEKYTAVVLRTTCTLSLPGKIIYVSEGVTVLSARTAECTDTLSVVIYKS